MPKVVFLRSGKPNAEVEVPVGASLMRGAVENQIYEILAECGGNMACATCHVYVNEEDLPRLTAPTPGEIDMLEYARAPKRPNSRLSCQIVVTEALDGLTATIPEEE
ncbi:2Fe-2S iron-sulfur cluster-binding protein [Peristeroidobacter soli]|uniref:2Fe-2S iron-sulfur cluster-binding protein n=1 Tax=Peristeroidobacter soli TaxID=2497877 RepID=UPI00101DF09E|nr:2Fe-2S iron-sulfur cluster-binding protein [Peristeroidobacter soli]